MRPFLLVVDSFWLFGLCICARFWLTTEQNLWWLPWNGDDLVTMWMLEGSILILHFDGRNQKHYMSMKRHTLSASFHRLSRHNRLNVSRQWSNTWTRLKGKQRAFKYSSFVENSVILLPVFDDKICFYLGKRAAQKSRKTRKILWPQSCLLEREKWDLNQKECLEGHTRSRRFIKHITTTFHWQYFGGKWHLPLSLSIWRKFILKENRLWTNYCDINLVVGLLKGLDYEIIPSSV